MRYKEAAMQGSVDALYYLALCYYEGKGVERDLAESVRCFEAILECDDATKVEADMIPKGYRVRVPMQRCIGDYKEEAKLRLEKLADIDSGKGIGILDYRYAGDYMSAEGEEDKKKYKRLWMRAEKGDLKAQKKVADKILFIISWWNDPDADGETMLRYYKSLAEQGNKDAMFSLFSIYHYGYSAVGLGNRDDKESLKWCEMAAENGVPHAQKWMYKFYSEGIGVEKDEEVANMWKQRMEERKHK
jgi:TPR repeat protein